MKRKYGEKVKLCYIDINSLLLCIKTEDIYLDIAKDVKTRFGTSNYELDWPLPNRKNKKEIGLMKDKLNRKLMKEFTAI